MMPLRLSAIVMLSDEQERIASSGRSPAKKTYMERPRGTSGCAATPSNLLLVHTGQQRHQNTKRWLRRCYPSNKKGQMEAVGLVMIVILVTLGMLFLTIFYFKDADSSETFTRKGLAYSSLSSLLRTNVECIQPDGSLVYPQLGKELLIDCAENKGLGAGFCTYQCLSEDGRQHCCDLFHEEAKRLLDSSLGAWNKEYQFQVMLKQRGSEEREELDIINRQACQKKNRDSSGIFPISTDIGLVESVLYIC